MRVLIGTTNPSKVNRMKEILDGYDVEFITLKDLKEYTEPLEEGKSPIENSVIKVKHYSKYFDVVISNDSGLYFVDIPLNDPRQPGLNVRTPNGSKRLDDEEMISYYSELISTLGGRVTALYMDGIAVYNKGKIFSFMEDFESTKGAAFYMVDKVSKKRQEGWPLNSLSININTGTYFVDKGNNRYDSEEENIRIGNYRKRILEFLKNALELN